MLLRESLGLLLIHGLLKKADKNRGVEGSRRQPERKYSPRLSQNYRAIFPPFSRTLRPAIISISFFPPEAGFFSLSGESVDEDIAMCFIEENGL